MAFINLNHHRASLASYPQIASRARHTACSTRSMRHARSQQTMHVCACKQPSPYLTCFSPRAHGTLGDGGQQHSQQHSARLDRLHVHGHVAQHARRAAVAAQQQRGAHHADRAERHGRAGGPGRHLRAPFPSGPANPRHRSTRPGQAEACIDSALRGNTSCMGYAGAVCAVCAEGAAGAPRACMCVQGKKMPAANGIMTTLYAIA